MKCDSKLSTIPAAAGVHQVSYSPSNLMIKVHLLGDGSRKALIQGFEARGLVRLS